MALLFCDSFDHYDDAQIQQKWSSVTGNPAIDATSRFGAGCLEANGGSTYVQKTVTAAATYIFGFAFRISNTAAADAVVFTTLEGTTVHVDLRFTPTQTLRVTRNGTSLGVGTTVLSLNTYYYIELKVTISDTVGVAVLKINGSTELNLTSQDTRNGGTGVIDNFRMGYNGSAQGSNPVRYDDFVLLDTSGGAPNNDFIGDVRVEALFPNGNGNSSQFTGSDGNSTDNYLLVDETVPNDDTDYVEDGTVNDKDTYTYTDLTPGSGTVYGVQPVPYARKTDAGARSIQTIARLSGTETTSADDALATTYLYYPDVRATKPGGGSWSVSDVNSAEFGYKVSV